MVMELGGPTIDALSLEGRQTITCLAMFTGAITAIINPDEKALDYIRPSGWISTRSFPTPTPATPRATR
jgi:homoaconitase/3-isopropylmalate dehydratase large subunit